MDKSKSNPNSARVSVSIQPEPLDPALAQITHRAKFLQAARRQAEQTVKLGDVMQSIEKALKLDKKAQELSLLMLWPNVVQEVNASAVSRSRALKVTNHKGQKQLEVAVSEPALLSVLQFASVDLMKKLNQFAPQTGITLQAIRFVIRHHGDYQ